MTITAVIITKNEAANITSCLNSLQNVADEIIVLDAFSTDETLNICKSYPSVKFIQRVWKGYAASKIFANSLAKGNYILSLDADEILSEELKSSILNVKSYINIGKAFQFNRLNHIIDQPIHHSGWYPDRKIRFFPKNNSKWVGDFVHERLQTESNVEALKGDLLHFTYSSIEQMEKNKGNMPNLVLKSCLKKGSTFLQLNVS